MGVITSADAVLTLQVIPIFPIPVQIQGFSTEDIYNMPRVRSVEVQMGVDGVLSGGFVYREVVQEIMLQADSASNRFFEAWYTAMQSTKGTYPAVGLIKLPGIATKFIQNLGFLTNYSPAPAAGKTLRRREYEITWQSVIPAPA